MDSSGMFSDYDYSVRSVSVIGGAITTLCVPNPRRVVLIFSSLSSTPIIVAPSGMVPSATQGIIIPTSNTTLIWTCPLHNILPKLEWKCSTTVNANMTVVEVFDMPR